MDGIFGLGFSETIVVIVAIILLIEPKNMVYLKPLIKAGYKAWLSYKRDVEDAQREMEGVKQSMMEPIMAAKKEAEEEARSMEREVRSSAESAKTVSKPKAEAAEPDAGKKGKKGPEGGAP